MYQHPTNSTQFAEYLNNFAILVIDTINTIVSKKMHLPNAVTEDTITMVVPPEINLVLKASKELQLLNNLSDFATF